MYLLIITVFGILCSSLSLINIIIKGKDKFRMLYFFVVFKQLVDEAEQICIRILNIMKQNDILIKIKMFSPSPAKL